MDPAERLSGIAVSAQLTGDLKAHRIGQRMKYRLVCNRNSSFGDLLAEDWNGILTRPLSYDCQPPPSA
jgi:hypothetical protein